MHFHPKRKPILALFLFAIILFIWFNHYSEGKIKHIVILQPPQNSKHDQQLLRPPLLDCTILTSPNFIKTRAVHVESTWAKECSSHQFISSESSRDLENVVVINNEGIEHLWGKVLQGFRSLNSSKAFWFLKADDDTYVVVPNLLQFLAQFNHNKPIVMGFPLEYKTEDETVAYVSGGAGYVLSREALRRIQKAKDEPKCTTNAYTIYEDVNMCRCLSSLGVAMMDTRDVFQRHRFLPLPPNVLILKENEKLYPWIKEMAKYPLHFGLENLSDDVFTFHQVHHPQGMYFLQFFTRDLTVI